MKQIIHEDAIDRLMEQFTPEQMREISFALNPDSENLDWTIYNIEEKSLELDYTIDDLKERVMDLDLLVKDYHVLKDSEFIIELIDQVDELITIWGNLHNE